MVEKDLEAVRMAAQSDYEYFISFEDSSTQNYSPSQYEQYISSEIRQWCAILAEHGKKYVQHACGHVKALVKPMLEDGVCAVESISPPPTGNISIAEVRGIVGDRMGIIGGIEPTELLNLDIDALSSYVEKVIAEGRGGPFVLANSDSCPPRVTIEKFQRIVEVAKTCRG